MKEFRIYRSNKPANGSGSYNTYLQYFEDFASAKKAAKSRDRWECQSVQIEMYDKSLGKWIAQHA